MDSKTEKNLLKIVRENYQKAAASFNETRKKAAWPELKSLLVNIDTQDKILDVGCGNGRLFSLLSVKPFFYLGIDQSENMIALAKINHPTGDFRVGDICDLGQIKEGDFSQVFCLAVLHHLPSHRLRLKALKQLKNKVSDKGRVVISVWNLWGNKKLRWLIWRFWLLRLIGKHRMNFGDIIFSWKNSDGKVVSPRYYHAFSRRQLSSLVLKAGFEIEKLKKDKYNYWLILKKNKTKK